MALPYFQHSRLFFFKTLSSSLSILTAGKPTGGKKKWPARPKTKRVLRSTLSKPLPPHQVKLHTSGFSSPLHPFSELKAYQSQIEVSNHSNHYRPTTIRVLLNYCPKRQTRQVMGITLQRRTESLSLVSKWQSARKLTQPHMVGSTSGE